MVRNMILIRTPHRPYVKLCFSALNISPRFYSRYEVAKALSAYYFGLSLRRVEALFHVSRSTVLLEEVG